MTITEATVIGGAVVRVGDRVKHYGQRYGYLEGTATVTGFEMGPEGYPRDWVRVVVEPDRPDSWHGFRWDWDRTEKVGC